MFVTTNRTSVQPVTIRTEYLDGRPYWVAPLVMIVEGIHTGSSGPVFYSANSLALSAAAWNMKPIVVYHPQDSKGNFITAANKATIENQQVGLLFNVRFDGKLRADAWIDQAKSSRVDRRVEKAIDSQRIMEVSTGLYFDPVLQSGTWQGKYFNCMASNIQPDHLALLPDMKGACSIEDGAGLLQVNTKVEPLPLPKWPY